MPEVAAVPQKKKAAHRSPNYPAFSLTSALEKCRSVYDAEKRTATTPEVIVQHLGFKDTDGPGGRSLSCLRQFGLLEESAGKLRVSDAAFSLLHLPDTDQKKAQLMREAALKPNLYHALHEDYPETLPSDATLQSNLLGRGFNPQAIEGVIANFRATMEVAKVYDVTDNGAEDESKMHTDPNAASSKSPLNTPAQTMPPGLEATGNRIYALAFEGDGQATLSLKGTYTAEDLDDLEAYITTSLKILRRSVKKDSVQ